MSLHDLAVKHGTDKGKKHRYCDIYERFFKKYRSVPITLLEFGVDEGASLLMWQEYFYLGRIIGVDKVLPELPGVEMIKADQRNYETPICCDIIIDDCSHEDENTLLTMFKNIGKTTLYYCIEDTNCKRFKRINEFIDMISGVVYRDNKLAILKGQYGS